MNRPALFSLALCLASVAVDLHAQNVERDHFADLVILDANPLEDIRNVRRIYRVVKAGVAYDPATR